MPKFSQNLLLKDKLFNQKNVKYLANLIKNIYTNLDQNNFEKDILEKFPELELKERISWVRRIIEKNLPSDYKTTVNVLLECIKNEPENSDFIFASFSEYIEIHGCNEKYLEISLDALGQFTKYFSAEFSIRCFINTFPEKIFLKMQEWSFSKNQHQRRLATEGLRPKLPWAKAILFDYKKGSIILDNLFYDTERYIVRSVANHLNDISKINPDFVLEKLEEWKNSKKQNEKEMKYMINHSLRTSIKKGHQNTFNFLGYNSQPKINITNFKIEKKDIQLGEPLLFSFEIISKAPENLIIDYKIIYPNPQKRHSEKVFKIKTTHLKKNEEIKISKKHLFKIMTTKKLYSGTYRLEIQINGIIMEVEDFNLQL
jgi:3-methyladenine DNA glycosylase AlkC